MILPLPERTFLWCIDTDTRNSPSLLLWERENHLFQRAIIFFGMILHGPSFHLNNAQWYCRRVFGTDLPRIYASARGPICVADAVANIVITILIIVVINILIIWHCCPTIILRPGEDILYFMYVDLCSELEDTFIICVDITSEGWGLKLWLCWNVQQENSYTIKIV